MTTRAMQLAAVVALCFSASTAHAFLTPMHSIYTNSITSNNRATTTSLTMGKRKKPSMKERRKNRAKKQPGYTADRGILNDMPAVDTWEKPTVIEAVKASDLQTEEQQELDKETEETKAKASSLVELQRKSVDSLTFIRKRTEETFPMNEAAKSIVEKGYYVHDNFLSSGEDEAFGDVMLSDMFQEGSYMLSNDKLERDITRLGDGEYLAKIVGGDAYVNCPRATEYVVSLTRHLPPLYNNEMDALRADDVSRLDATASMGTIRVYDRKTRLGEETFVSSGGDDTPERPYGNVCGDSEGTENDARRLTAMLYLSSKEWNASCGGGVTMEGGDKMDAVRDRLVLLRSDTCSLRQEPWQGADEAGLDQASCIVVHFVKA